MPSQNGTLKGRPSTAPALNLEDDWQPAMRPPPLAGCFISTSTSATARLVQQLHFPGLALAHDHVTGKKRAEGQENRCLAQLWSKVHCPCTKPRWPFEVDVTGRIGPLDRVKSAPRAAWRRQLLVTNYGTAARGAAKAGRTTACGLQQSF